MFNKRSTTHGQCGVRTPTYLAWQNMKHRCRSTLPRIAQVYKDRGITFCDRWQRFENFLEDMGEMPQAGMTIDRLDNNLGYFKENCRWLPRSLQNRNKRTNRIIEFNGERKLLVEWAELIGIDKASMRYRLKHFPLEIALTMPVHRAKQRGRMASEHERGS
jgi:hypothetical protein